MPDVPLPETKKIVLSVNDSPTMGEAMFEWLYTHGVAIVRASSTAKAMELLSRYQFDAVITNLRRLEYGAREKNNNAGIELTQQIRRVNQEIPIFIYTMNIDQVTRQFALSAGATLITTNPNDLQAALGNHGF